jgi:hypothetical protein
VIVVVGLLRQARWGWWVAVSLGSMWLVSGVLSVISIVTSPLLWASPLLAPVVLCYVASLIAALVLLFTPRGRAPFRRPLAPPVTVP